MAESSSLGESGVRTRIMAKDDLVNRRLAEKEDAHTAAFLKEEGDAAKRIQASFRGHKDRRDIVASRRAEVQEAFDRDCKEQDEAAVRLQGSFRGYRVSLSVLVCCCVWQRSESETHTHVLLFLLPPFVAAFSSLLTLFPLSHCPPITTTLIVLRSDPQGQPRRCSQG